MFDLGTILPLVCAVFVGILAWFVFFENTRSPLNRLFVAFSVAMIIWLVGTFMMFVNRESESAAIWWDRFVYLGVTMMPALMHHFSLIFTGRQGQRKLLLISYLGSVFFLIISRTPYFVDGLYRYDWGAHTQAKLFHHLFLVFFYWGVQIFIINIWRAYKQSQDKQFRKQALYVVLAFSVVMFVGGTAYLTAYGIDIRYPFSYISGLAFPFILAYAISQHHLLGARVISTEIFIGVILFLTAAELFLSRSFYEIAWRGFFALVIGSLGWLLLRTIKQEVDKREEIQKLAGQVEEANKTLVGLDKAKSEFLSIVAHQLRTPLTVIGGYISLLREGAYGKADTKVNEVFSAIDQNNKKLNQLVDEFLDITRLEEQRLQYVARTLDIRKIIENVVEHLKEIAKSKKVKINVSLPDEPVFISGDEEKLNHIFDHLIDNAIKYGQAQDVNVKMIVDGEGVLTKIKDKGIGVAEADLPNLFQKFYRTENAKMVDANGVGLGLFLCKKFVEAHNGSIWAESSGTEKGTTFNVWLPLKR